MAEAPPAPADRDARDAATDLAIPDYESLGILNDDNKSSLAKVRELQEQYRVLTATVRDLTDRAGIMKTHLSNVQAQQASTNDLVKAKSQEVHDEEHMKQLADRQMGRIKVDMEQLDRLTRDADEKSSATQNGLFAVKEQLQALENDLKVTQEAIDQWALANRQKENDNEAVGKYYKADEAKVRDLTLQLERLTKEVQDKRKELASEVTETQAEQIKLDRTAEDFRALHRRRQELIQMWEEVVHAMEDRDASIERNRDLFAKGKEEVQKVADELQDQKRILEQQQQHNRQLDAKIKAADNQLNQNRAEYGSAQRVVDELQDEVQVHRNTLLKDQADLDAALRTNAARNQTIEDLKSRLAREQSRVEQKRKQLAEEGSISKDCEKQALAIEALHREEEEHLHSVEKELKELKEEMFRESQVLFRASQQKSNIIAEINGAEASLKNLQAKIRKLDAESTKQRELIYQADFQIQLLERKVPRAAGQRTDEEKMQLTKRIEALKGELEQHTSQWAMLTQQVKRLEEELRHAQRQVDDHEKDSDMLASKIADLRLSNENALRELKLSTSAKEELAVQHDVLKLELKRLKDVLNARLDDVFGLENRRDQLRMTIQERETEIRAHVDVLKAQLKIVEEDGHKVSIELGDREVKVEKLRQKFESIVAVRGGSVTEETEHTQAFVIVEAAQQKQQLQQQGDELDQQIRKKETEVRQLDNTLEHIRARNSEYRTSFTTADAEGRDFEEKEALDEQLRAAVDKAKYKRRELAEVRGLMQFQERTLTDSEHECDLLERNIQELELRQQQIEKDLEAQGPKLARAQQQMQSLSESHRRARNVAPTEETDTERDFQLAELRETNQVVLQALVQLGKQYPDVGTALNGLFEAHGIRPPTTARPGSSRSAGGRA